jgi:hypothetical protein
MIRVSIFRYREDGPCAVSQVERSSYSSLVTGDKQERQPVRDESTCKSCLLSGPGLVKPGYPEAMIIDFSGELVRRHLVLE